MTEQPPDELYEDPEIEWRRVAEWPAESLMLRKDIAQIIEVLDLLDGAADDAACHVAVDFLREALLTRRRELASLILIIHGIDIPEPGDVKTPQERMSEQLRRARDMVAQRRADIRPPDQPFTDRYGPGRPGLDALQHGGGLHRTVPRMPHMTPDQG